MKFKEVRKQNQNSLLILLLSLKAAGYKKVSDDLSELILFLAQYSFLFENSSDTLNSCAAEQSQLLILHENEDLGARYLDPKYSMWKSTDPALGEYIPQAGSDNSSLPGMGGVYNYVNLNLYHYAGNNPIRYVDPDGRFEYEVKEGDTLSQMVSEHNKKYNTNYTYNSIALHNGIKDPNKIKVGQIIDIPIPGEEMRYPIYHSLKKTVYQEKSYPKVANFFIGVGEIVLGAGTWVGTVAYAGTVTVATDGLGALYAGMVVEGGIVTGGFWVGYGISRITGKYNKPFLQDLKDVAMPVEAALVDE